MLPTCGHWLALPIAAAPNTTFFHIVVLGVALRAVLCTSCGCFTPIAPSFGGPTATTSLGHGFCPTLTRCGEGISSKIVGGRNLQRQKLESALPASGGKRSGFNFVGGWRFGGKTLVGAIITNDDCYYCCALVHELDFLFKTFVLIESPHRQRDPVYIILGLQGLAAHARGGLRPLQVPRSCGEWGCRPLAFHALDPGELLVGGGWMNG